MLDRLLRSSDKYFWTSSGRTRRAYAGKGPLGEDKTEADSAVMTVEGRQTALPWLLEGKYNYRLFGGPPPKKQGLPGEDEGDLECLNGSAHGQLPGVGWLSFILRMACKLSHWYP